MNILILEDDPSRVKKFRAKLIGHNLTVTDDSKACIKLLESGVWDILCLDHDLGGQVYVASGENTGYEVAKWLELNPKNLPSTIYIHSLNGVGAANMKACLPQAIQVPFLWEVLQMPDQVS